MRQILNQANKDETQLFNSRQKITARGRHLHCAGSMPFSELSSAFLSSCLYCVCTMPLPRAGRMACGAGERRAHSAIMCAVAWRLIG
jgi:hypothetical protein